MKKILLSVLPILFIEKITKYLKLYEWQKRGFSDNSPQFIKEKIFIKHSVVNAQWVETGTYFGTSTHFLSKRFPIVHSIEPSQDLYNKALSRFKGRNVKLYNDVSENIFPQILPTLEGDINFWLDGHYSDGITFKGEKDCPVEDELISIGHNVHLFNKVSILIDDARCFLPNTIKYDDYPSIDFIIDWARKYQFNWRIEHDILILKNY